MCARACARTHAHTDMELGKCMNSNDVKSTLPYLTLYPAARVDRHAPNLMLS